MIRNTIDWILPTFLKLTSQTYPYGYEDELVKIMLESKLLPEGIEKDQFGNYFLSIGDSKTVFASHLDTACSEQVNVAHIIDGDLISTDKTSILGADDKAGVTILLWMIKHNIPGLYYFFLGEEVGCLGSEAASRYPKFKNYDRIISFDRRGTQSVITFQSYRGRTCSDDFAVELSNRLNKSNDTFSFSKDSGGVYTDSAEFSRVIPECTNISVGYYSEHTNNENQDIGHLVKLADACLLIDWETLPTVRNPSLYESKTYTDNNGIFRVNLSSRSYSQSYDTNDWYIDDGLRKKRRTRRSKKNYSYRNRKAELELDGDDDPSPFWDAGNGELESMNRIGNELFRFKDPSEREGIYESVKIKFLNGEISKVELDIIRDQYFDMENEQDAHYYEFLRKQITT